jgi:ATP-dependent Lon protease
VDLLIPDTSIKMIVRRYTREAGVRNLEREIASICRKVARQVVKDLKADEGKEVKPERKYYIGLKMVHKYLGVPKFKYGIVEEEEAVGLATGLAWTEVGGELLTIETTIVPGKGKLTITGKLGEVMQESAQAAMSYVRSRAHLVGLSRDFYSKVDLHVHVPEGAIPKDGPSAGIAICTALFSALTRIPVYSDVAMTGEITLRGRVLPIGGLKEKLLAAHRGGVKRVIIPKDNEKDLKEIPKKILNALEILPVDDVDSVLRIALHLKDPKNFLKVPDDGNVYPSLFDEPKRKKEVSVPTSDTSEGGLAH